MSISAGIVATKATLELTKIVSDLVKRPNIDAADVQGKLHELLIHAVNAQTALGDAQIEMAELRRQLDDREDLKAIQLDLEMDVISRYWVRKSEKERGLIPYCPTCWGVDSKLVPLALFKLPGNFYCAIHKNHYYSPEHIEAERASAQENRARRGPIPGSAWS